VLCIAILIRDEGKIAAVAGGVPSVSNLIILELDQWIGQKLPVANSLDIDLSVGD